MTRRPTQQSLRQEYVEFLEQKIEEYKERLSREELLAVADEAVRELEYAGDEQLLLTEMLMLEHVDRLIMKRMNLPTFRRWRNKHVKRRQAQRDPKYWGLESNTPVVSLAGGMFESDNALILGKAAVPAALFLAAHDWTVLFIDSDLSTVEGAEKSAGSEELASRFQALVVNLGDWFPDSSPALVVLDPSVLSDLKPQNRVRVLDTLKQMTKRGGIHCLLPIRSNCCSLEPGVIRAHYGDWSPHHRRRESPDWYLASKP